MYVCVPTLLIFILGMNNANQNMGGGGGGGGGRNFVEIMIPGPKVGLIIGKGGETIKQLQERSGAKMVVIQVKFLSYLKKVT